MSLSQKLSALDETKKKNIEAQLQEKFPNSVEVQVLFLSRVLEWMDSRPWETSHVAAYSVMNTITTMLQDKISGTEDMQGKSIQYLLSTIQNAYSDKPIALLQYLFKIYNFTQNLVNEMVVSEAGISLDNAAHDSNDNTSVTKDQSFDFHKNLESLETLVKENDDLIREIQQKIKEREKLFFSQNNLEIENLKITNNNSVTMQDKSNEISEVTKSINENKNDIEKQNQSIVASLKLLLENISVLVFTKNKDLQSRIFSQISEWNHNKLQAQVGWPVYPFSDFLQPLIPVCNRFAKILLSTHSQAQKLADILSKIGADTESLKCGENMRNTSRSMLCAFLKSCFVVDKQPPPTQLIDKVLRVSLRLLLGSDVLSPSVTPTVTCSLHLDDEIRRFQTNFENVKVQDVNVKSVTNNEKVLTYDQQTDSFCVSFDKLKLPRKLEKRKTKLDGDKTKLVTDQKSCLMFQTQITIGNENFTIEAFSVPIVVMTNTSQCLESEATIFWDNAFASKDREPFTSPDGVTLKDVLEALNKRWAKSNERELEEHHLHFLAKKLFPDTDIKFEELHKYTVTKQMFNKEHTRVGTCTFPFTFWSWFYKAMKLVKEFLYDEWRDDKIYGFIDKSEAEFKLSEHLVGTFLLRFSDSVPGGISITYKESMEVPGCNHVVPWTKDELKQKSFSNSMNDLQNHSVLRCLQYLYPSATPINEAFPQKEESSSEEFNPRYPKNATLRVVRHDDGGSASASNFSSNQSVSFHNTSPPPSAEGMSESTNGNEQAFSPLSLSLDDDPMFGQANQYYPSEFMGGNLRMDGENEDLF